MTSDAPDTRGKILDAALALLMEGGGAGARMADIARRAGVSRQAVYLHFASRAELLVAAARRLDAILGSDDRLAPSRAARSGVERLDAYVSAWTAFIPEIHPTARALMAMSETDAEAAAAWDDRMEAMRDGCAAAVAALARDGALAAELDEETAVDLLWSLLSVRGWEMLTEKRGWTQARYEAAMKRAARRLLVAA